MIPVGKESRLSGVAAAVAEIDQRNAALAAAEQKAREADSDIAALTVRIGVLSGPHSRREFED